MRSSLFALAPFVLAGACASTQEKPAPSPAAAAATAPAPKKSEDTTKHVQPLPADTTLLVSGPVYFDYDSSSLKPDAQEKLRQVATHLAKHPDAQIVVEGHCDDRGTEEYNLALGQQRGDTIRDYLVRLGARKEQVLVVSYGKLRPAVNGRGEDSWAKNRRGELKPEPRG